MNFQTICRVCTRENLEMVSIFESHNFSADNYEISKIITDCASVQIQKLDGFSQQICRRCLDHLSQAYSFKRLCEDSDYKFRNNLIASIKMEIKDEVSAEDTKIIFDEMNNYCINENTDETLKITHIGLAQVQKEQCNDVIKIENKSEKNQYEEVKQELDSTSAFSGLFESKGSQALIGVKYAQHTKSDTSEPSNDVIKTEDQPDNQNETEEEELPIASLSSNLLDSINSEESPILKNSQFARSQISKSCGKVDSPHKCQPCNKSFVQKKYLLRHIKRIHSEQHPYKCGVCSKEFRQRSLLTQHMKTHKEEIPFVCHVCGKTFIQKRQLLFHLELHSGDERYECDICGIKILHKSTLVKHVKAHTKGISQTKCNICGKLLNSNLKVHMRTHTGEKPFKCNICDRAFSKSGALKVHIRSHTGEKPHKCDVCGKKFSEKRYLMIHEERHKGKNSYKCDICGKIFAAHNTLKIHIRDHTGEVCKCDFCDKKFPTHSALIIHIRIHTGEKPYKCEFCDKTFAQASNLQVHVRTHMGEKPYKCHLCEKLFAVSTYLTIHIRTHTGDKPFKCDICDENFISRSQMMRHIMRLHPRQ